MGVGALCYVALHMIAPLVTMGRMQTNMFQDIENAQMIMVWGTNPATDSPPIDLQRLEAAAKRGADIVVIDPRHTETAIRTNAQWIPIRPGTDGALALSMIQVMIEEDLHDENFAEKWCHGFSELVTYVQHFNPEIVENITGVPAATIKDLARRICNASGATVLMYTGIEYSGSGVQSARAIHTLFALAGHLDVPGGIGLAMLNTDFPDQPLMQPGKPKPSACYSTGCISNLQQISRRVTRRWTGKFGIGRKALPHPFSHYRRRFAADILAADFNLA